MMRVQDDLLWSITIALKQSLKDSTEVFEYAIVFVADQTFTIHINKNKSNIAGKNCIIISKEVFKKIEDNHTFIKSEGLLDLAFESKGFLNESAISFFKIYLPYILSSIEAERLKRSITISHFAQSLDGKIATNTGNSQWIGNEENLIHSHRMRALCDAILIGTNTLKNDKPSLTVRKVAGNNPIKIVMGNAESPCFKSLQKEKEKIIYITTNERSNCQGIETILIKSQNRAISCAKILSQLFNRGIHSVYIEGGGKTTSGFLKSKTLDIIQLHIAPMIIGSGIPNFQLPEINSIDQAIAFKNHMLTPAGSHIMFTGAVKN